MSDDKGKGICSNVSFDCVMMSKAQFRTITGQMPESGKTFKIIYE